MTKIEMKKTKTIVHPVKRLCRYIDANISYLYSHRVFNIMSIIDRLFFTVWQAHRLFERSCSFPPNLLPPRLVSFSRLLSHA